MSRTPLSLVTIALLTAALAGCLGGDDDVDGLPVAVVTVDPIAGEADTYRFDASGSTGRGLRFAWDLGDGTISDEAIVEHTYSYGSGVYAVALTITDLQNVTAFWTRDITIGTGVNGAPEATFSLSTRYLAVNEPLTVDARGTLDPEEDPIIYEWDFNFFPMDLAAYEAFREAKMDVEPSAEASAPASTPASGQTGSPASAPTAPVVDPRGLLSMGKDAGHCHGSCSNEDPPSFEFITATTQDPVYTLAAGFPTATTYYVKLVAKDIKGGFQQILSEEIFPVKVVDTKEAETYTGSISGNFTLGGPSMVTGNTSDQPDVYNDERAGDDAWKFTIDRPAINATFDFTWSAETDVAEPTQSSIDVEVVSPAGKKRHSNGPNTNDGGIQLVYGQDDGAGSGTWTVSIYGRLGVQISYEAQYSIVVDLNPFREIEAPYL